VRWLTFTQSELSEASSTVGDGRKSSYWLGEIAFAEVDGGGRKSRGDGKRETMGNASYTRPG